MSDVIDDLRRELANLKARVAHLETSEYAAAVGDADTVDGFHAADLMRFYDAYVCVRDKKAQNTHGGTFTQGAWQTRDINDEHADTTDICSLAANQITLAAGSYRCLIIAPALSVVRHQARLYNITDAAILLMGLSAFANLEHTSTSPATIQGRFTLAATKVLEVQHRCETTGADFGFGIACNFTDEIYTVAEFWREA